MADFKFTTDLFNGIDKITAEFVANNIAVITSVVTPVIAAGLVLAIIVEGMRTLTTGDGEPIGELVGKFVRYAIIISIASAGGWYQKELANVAMKTPDEFSKSLIIKKGSSSSTEMASTIDTVLNSGLAVSKKAFDNGGIWSGEEILNVLLGVVIAGVVLVVCGLGAAFIIMAKVLLSLAVSFGPLAIFLLLWDGTKGIFDKWLGSVITYGLIIVLYAAVFGLLLTIFKQVVDSANGTSNMPVMNAIFTSVLLGIVIYFVMKQIPDMAANWGSGINAQFRRWVRPNKGDNNKSPGPGPAPTSTANNTGAGTGSGAGAAGAAGSAAAGAAGGPAGAAAAAAAKEVGAGMQGMAKGSRR